MHESGQRLRSRPGSPLGGLSCPRRKILGAATVAALAVVSLGGCSASGSANAGQAHGPSAHVTAPPERGALGHQAGPPAAGTPAQGRLGPVLLVPGYGGESGSLDVLATKIRATGREAIVLRLPGSGTGSLITEAALLNATAARVMRRGAPSVDVIGYSAGGVVALLWARHGDGASRARRIVTLGAPFHGTELAAAAQALVPGECPTACQQLVPGSSLLTSLDVARSGGLPPWLSLWTTDDEVVSPPDSARLAGAVDVPVQSICPALAVSHTELPSNPVVITMVLAAIGPSPLARPTAAACG
jgi:triacylglycerol lipase